MANSPPFFSGLEQFFSFGEEQVNLAPVVIDGTVVFFDTDDNFNGGKLELSGFNTDDIVSIRNAGAGSGQIGFDGSNVTFEGRLIGTATGGDNGISLIIIFNGSATSTAIERLIENLTLHNLSDTPTFTRSPQLTITDADGATAQSSVFMTAVTGMENPFNGIDVGSQSAPRFADIDGDGDDDALIGADNGQINYYENTGSAVSPAYTLRTGVGDPFNGVDVGLRSTLSLADIDGDGDVDALIGSNSGALSYYENTGSAGAPNYTLRTGVADPFDGINLTGAIAPEFSDIDDDGDLDAAIGASTGEILYLENTGTAASPAYLQRLGAANPFDAIDVGLSAAIVLADVDNDGDVDAVVGRSNGSISYYENTGTALLASYVERTSAANPFDGFDAGALSSPELADLDGDGKLDLAVGNSEGTVDFFEAPSVDSALREPAFKLQSGADNPFQDINNINGGARVFPSFADLDGDGDQDAITGVWRGVINYYENIGNSLSPTFVHRTGPANPFDSVDVHHYAAPTFADLDGDGDFDAIIGANDGTLYYFRNIGTAAVPLFAQLFGSDNPFFGIDTIVDSAPVLADVDDDGDLDAIAGGYLGKVQYFENTGNSIVANFVERTNSSNPFNQIELLYDSVPALADLDGDGDLDALVGAPRGTLSYYENTGTSTAPIYTARSGTAQPFNGIDVGSAAAPSFVDLDGDGDFDVAVGEYDGTPNYFENTATNELPEFDLATGGANPFNGIDIGEASAPGFADLDGDGDVDVVIGDQTGVLSYFENTGSPLIPVFSQRIGAANPFDGLDLGNNSTPTLADLDRDGDFDAFAGRSDGTIAYLENTGSKTSPSFVERSGVANPFNGIDVGNNSALSLVDLDGDGDLDAVVGEDSGTLKYFENSGSILAPVFTERTGTANPLNGVDVGSASTPSFADLDDDGDIDAVIGESDGTLNYYKNIGDRTAPAFIKRLDTTNPFNGVDVGADSISSFADLDGDGDLDQVLGKSSGTLEFFENATTGSAGDGFNFVVNITPHADPSESADVITGTSGEDKISGLGGNDVIRGLAGNDLLIGGSGNDITQGGLGDDTHLVDSANDVVGELAGEGTNDRVGTKVSYTLAANAHIEQFTTTAQYSTAAIHLTGNALSQTIIGNAGDNIISDGGGAGADLLRGLLGNDTYIVKNAATKIIEPVRLDPHDRVAASISYRLGTGVEVELFTTTSSRGTSAINLTGNEFAQTIIGNAGANRIDGGLGAGDILRGLGGNDTYIVRQVTTRVVEGSNEGASDRVSVGISYKLGAGVAIELMTTTSSTGTGAVDLTGNELAQTIFGNAGVNVISDGSGAGDVLRGLGGSDIYIVRSAATKIIESAAQGANDKVAASISYALDGEAAVEELATTSSSGSAAINLTGNSFAQTITGNAGANVLIDGLGQSDFLRGLGGDDTYIVRNTGTVIVENAGQGKLDRVAASVDFALASDDNIERLSTTSSTGSTGIDLTGNGLKQAITGNAGANRIDSKGGSDTLRGLGGDDTFVFSTKLGRRNIDKVVDFSVIDDQIELDTTIFSAVVQSSGTMLSGYFKANKTGAATDANDRIIYDTTSGELYYDPDGKGGGAGKQFADLAGGLALRFDDFDIV